mgnify:CR=1 FL=1|tara:strand:+ start:14168 stop:14587 length:420 start_codon:yes stop_codon:yes gene_type:complete
MQTSAATLSEVFDGLQALSQAAFPKQCGSCGKEYVTLEQLVEGTTPQQGSGLKETLAGSSPTVEMECECSCGCLLTERFSDRRSCEAVGSQRRNLFDRLLSLLTEGGMPVKMAKKELLKVMKGQSSELLDREQLARFFS